MRTSFGYREGQPCQLITMSAPLGLRIEDLSKLEPAEREQTAVALVRTEVERPFDLRQAPQLRVRVMRLSEREHVLLLVLHHIVCDGWSMEVLFKELELFYNGGVAAEIAELPVHYADYALWQREHLEGAELETQLAYWREQFRGELPVLELPTDRGRPAVQSYRGGLERRQLGQELLAALDQLGQQHGATLFMVLLAAFQVLLSRYTGQDDIVVGTPVANRQRAEIEGLIGFFVNTLVLRSRVQGEQTFTELLAEVKEMCLEAYAHQDLPFEKLVEELQPKRNLSHSPLFQAMLTMRSDQRRPLQLRGLEATALSIEQSTAKFDWLLYTFVNDNGLQTALEYNSDLFDRTTAKCVLAHYEQLLQGLVANPAQRLAELPLLTKQERQQQLVHWNDTETEFPLHLTLAQMFEAQAEKTPDLPALRFEGTELTYRQLNQRVNQLAHYLREQGIGPEERVGVLMERSVEMVLSLLGVLKAGGVYMPLDPEYPTERLSTMIADAEPKLILTQQHISARLRGSASLEFCVDRDRELLNRYSDENLSHTIEPDNAVYMIYTSGSTGKPKGAINTHFGICNRLLWMQQAYQLNSEDRVLQKTPFTFDVSVWEFFWPLITGACLVVAKPRGHQDAEYLIDLIATERITTCHFVPSMLSVFLQAEGIERCTSLKRVICSGEALPFELQEDFFQRLSAELHNLYGPTEAAIDVTSWECQANSARPIVPIGRPIANTQVYVLDERFEPVPVGVAGELYLGGAGLARGYWGQAGLTAERFVPNPHGESGTRLYRTGDLVRYLADGELEFLGRLDSQVKLRGYRIELGEIEAVLRGHEQVREALVQVRWLESGMQLVAYVVLKTTGGEDDVRRLRSYLRERLPEYMVPGSFVRLEAMPLTANGKVDRRALPDPDVRGTPEEIYVAPQTELEQSLAAIWQEVLKLERVGLSDNFFDLGGHSLLLVQVRSKLRELLGHQVPVLELFKYPTIGSLAKHLSNTTEATDADSQFSLARARALVRHHSPGATRDVAIIGMAGRFPGAANVKEFWQNLRHGIESIREFSEEEVRAAGVSEQLLRQGRYVRAGAILDGVELFDAELFGITPREAEIMDPQQRVFLECAWETIENAGYDAASYPLPIGVFAGLSMNTYLLRHYASITSSGALNNTQVQLGNDKDFISTRVSYKLGLTGPSLTVQTACSTSLVSVHLACQSLLTGVCSMALAGGVSLRFPQKAGYLFQEGGIKSPDGHCRAFDVRAAGTVGGSGVGLVLLKPLATALADGDAIYAVIKGSAINNDGALKVGYTAPSVTGQATVIAEAQAMAGVSADTISYVEAHGTGTPLGDPIEVAALTQAFGKQDRLGHYCGLGSVKTNIGHLDAAAGVAGLIKTVLSLHHQELVPSLHYERPNPEIEFEQSPFYVNAELKPWPRTEGRPRRAGVSSFGIGGTNAHVVLEEAPLNKEETSAAENDVARREFLLLSTRNEASLKIARGRLADYLEQHPEQNLADVAYTLQVGRRSFAQRAAVICRTMDEAIASLRDDKVGINVSGEELHSTKGIVFLFPGQGAQQVNMGRSLYQTHGEFRRVVDECSEAAAPILGYDLRTVLYPDPGNEQSAQQQLRETAITQVALFTVEYALAEQLRVWGIRPAALLGHSLGEYVAACVSGTFSMEDAIKLVAERGRLMQQMPTGVMLAVTLDEPELREALAAVSNGSNERLSVTSFNGPQRNVVGGSAEAIEELEQYLNDKKVRTQRLQTSHAFHTVLVEPVLEQYRAVVEKTLRNPNLQVRYVSNTTGSWVTAAEVQQADYWVRHMREPVKFRADVTEIAREGNWLWLEVGPGNALSRLVRQQLKFLASKSENEHQVQRVTDKVLTTLSDGEGDELARVLRSVAQLWTAGSTPDWEALREWGSRQAAVTPRKPRRVWLPGYPFQRERFWLEPPTTTAAVAVPAPLKKTNLNEWFYIPSWKRSMPPKLEVDPKQQLTWLVFVDQNGLGSHLVARLKKSDQHVVSVVAGSEFIATGNDLYVIDPREQDHYDKLLLGMKRTNQTPHKVVHLWTAGTDTDESLGFDLLELYQRIGFYSLLHLAQALALHVPENEIRIDVVSTNLHAITGDEKLRPEHATLLGACKVISQEIPRLSCRSIDVRLHTGECVSDELVDQLVAEFSYDTADPLVGYRGEHRWIQSFEPVELKPALVPFKSKGVYLITGGLGGIGLALAEHLGQSMQAKLVLTGRSEFPDRESWESWLATHAADDTNSGKIEKLLALEKAGAEILVCQADVADEAQMRRVVEWANQRFGNINGVIHAAGLPGDGIIQRRTREMMDQVLAPKTKGTLVLDRLFKDTPLDFMVLCSSIASILGGVGGVDYCAANCFLDAYAQYRGREAKVFSINWDKWLEAGMAVNTPQSRRLAQNGFAGNHQPIGHPLIGHCIQGGDTEQTFETLLSVKTHWILQEHRVRGKGVLPGTAYLEMARAALAQFRFENKPVEIREITFISPLVVNDHEARNVRVTIRQHEDTFAFDITSKPAAQNGSEPQWVRHAGGTMNYLSDSSRRTIDLQAIKERCVERDIATLRRPVTQQRNYGPRWQTMRQAYFGADEGLAVFELPEEYAADLDSLPWHPALLDFPMSFLSVQYLDQGTYLPFNYHQLKVKAPLPRRLCSYAKLKPGDDPSKKQLAFEVLITDENGNELIEVTQFTMRRASEQFNSELPADAAEQDAGHGLRSSEGIEVLERVLASCTLPQIIVSTRDFPALWRHYQGVKAVTAAETLAAARPVPSSHARPALGNSYEAPRNEMEETIAEIWQRVLGIENIGINDDFLELGGDSLAALQLMSRLRETFDVEPPLARFFESPTISSVALLVVQQLAESTDSSVLSEILLAVERSSSQPQA
ncbi:MAG TPA: amino acid adenylation domain-containing protein [Pyrinomonadaceae bacterium]|nr:amino acid adenylation domain-containing protein [Pyrinomonadaceae bacterium]